MVRYRHLKSKAISLRQEGMTLPDICERLGLSKGTVYYWIKGIPIPRTEKQSAAVKRMAAAHIKRASDVRKAWYEEGVSKFEDIIRIPRLKDFITIYMAEGFRKTRHVVSVSNSDPSIVKLAHDSIKQIGSKNKYFYSVQIHVDNDEYEVKSFWAELLGIDIKLIRIIRKSNSGKLSGRQWRSIHGVFQVGVGDTRFRCWLEAWMDLTRKLWLSGRSSGV